MNILDSEKKKFNSIPTNETRRGGDIAIHSYNQGIEKIKDYEENIRYIKPKEEDFTLEMLQDIQTKVEGRETMGEVTKEETVYEETER